MASILNRHQSLVDELLAAARQRLSNEVYDLFAEFIRQYYLQVETTELAEYAVEDLYALAKSHWDLIQQRKTKTIKLRIFNPTKEDDGFTLPNTIVQLSMDNMPFLVDSMRMAISSLGYEVYLMVHTGGMMLERDRRGRVKDIKSYRKEDQNNLTEAPIAFVIDYLADEEEQNQLRLCLDKVLYSTTLAVDDWLPMRQAMMEAKELLSQENAESASELIAKSAQFLDWLLADHFTFLGCVDYQHIGAEDDSGLELMHNSGLGIFHDTSPKDHILYDDLPEKINSLMDSADTRVLVYQSDIKAVVHRAVDMDLVIIKEYDKHGNKVGQRHFYGLFTSTALATDPKNIPLLSHKVAEVIDQLDVPDRSYSGKDLKYILGELPRAALFECSCNELAQLARGILQLQERSKLRLFTYCSLSGKIFSCLVFLPRNSFNTELLYKMQSELERQFSATDSSFETIFSYSALARVHYRLHIDPKKPLDLDLKSIEAYLAKMSYAWQDELYHCLTREYQVLERNNLWKKYAYAFPAGYREDFSPEAALIDIKKLELLDDQQHLQMIFYSRENEEGMKRLKLFRAHETVALSDALPMFENIGWRVIGEHPYELTTSDGLTYWINDFSLYYDFMEKTDLLSYGELLMDTISAIWYGRAENDQLNRLILSAGLTWRQIVIFRAYARYMRQVGFTYSLQYIESTLAHYPQIVKMLFHYFNMRFNPDEAATEEDAEAYHATILEAIDQVTSLDEDKILRRYVELIYATLRINYFQNSYHHDEVHYLAIKLLSEKITGLEKPLPQFELYVYSPRFEGIHLRTAKVARGGLRWSDRPEDFRKEVLDLMKAQRVKNAVIVPQGAKGGFVLTALPKSVDRETLLEEGKTCYKQFISALLDLTDNIINDKIVPPKRTVCYDDPDPYLVVAADKGTATFSDMANQIAKEKSFWLEDAFASGGSAGYDHKKLGITAHGSWVAAEEHFRNLNINIEKDKIRVVGIGDMSGDVFGNGLLMSEHIELVAAFNHQYIFIDPTPNIKKSFRERKRLFQLPRSSWDDYDRGALSAGAGIYRRSAKSIQLSAEAMQALEIDRAVMNPEQLIAALLQAPVDLLWNGGVGTFVKASSESHLEVGDRANDGLRINASELRTKVVVEGGNLGLTQLARIEYALAGGLINTDFIDNSAGVDCSDQEVNIKILLQAVLRETDMDEARRNELLMSMTSEVKQLVLTHNVQQSRAITINTSQALHYFNLYQRFIEYLEQAGRMERAVEYLPSEQELVDRLAAGTGMTRPEIAVLFSYGKIDIKEHLLAGHLLEDPFFDSYLKDAFPRVLLERYDEFAQTHRLRSEIIATQLTNHLVADMGLSFVYQMQDETNAELSDVVRAYVIAAKVFPLRLMVQQVEALNYIVPVDIQHYMYIALTSLIRRSSRWILRHRQDYQNIPLAIDQFHEQVEGLSKRLSKLLLGDAKIEYDKEQERLQQVGVPLPLATQIAGVKAIYHAWNIVSITMDQDAELFRVAKIYFTIADRLDLLWFREQIDAYPSDTRWSILAKASYKSDLDNIQRDLTKTVLNFSTKARSIPGRLRAWLEHNALIIERWKTVIAALRGTDVKDFAILSIAIRNLQELTGSE